MTISKRGCREKGAQFERELVRRFREAMPGAEVKRGLQSRTGQEVPDVAAASFWIEAKRMKQCNIRAAYRQASGDAAKGWIPVAVTRDDRSEALVTLSLEDFLELAEVLCTIAGWGQ